MMYTIAFFLEGQLFLPYLTGALCVLACVSIFLSRRVRLAATLLGVVILLFGLVMWVTRLVAHPEDVGGANYLIDLGLAGGALLAAGAVRRKGD